MQVESARSRIQALIQPEGAGEEQETVVAPGGDAVPPLLPPSLPLPHPPDDTSANSDSALGDSQGVSDVLGGDAGAVGAGVTGGKSEVADA